MAYNKLGIKAVGYYNSASYGSPTWVPMVSIRDLKVDPTWDEFEANSRGSRMKTFAATLLGITVTGNLRADESATDYLYIRLALLAPDTAVDFMFLSGAKDSNGSTGFRFDGTVFGMPQDQGSGNYIYDDITIKPRPSDNPGKSALVASGAPVFTSIVS